MPRKGIAEKGSEKKSVAAIMQTGEVGDQTGLQKSLQEKEICSRKGLLIERKDERVSTRAEAEAYAYT